MALKQYDPKLILITFGPIPVSGFADGTFLKIENNEDAFTLQIGTDGEGTRSRSNDNSAKIEISLMQSSLSNDLLSQQHALDKATPLGIGCLPLLIKDLQGRAVFVAEKAWIAKRPAAEFGREAGARVWTLETDDLRAYDGGA